MITISASQIVRAKRNVSNRSNINQVFELNIDPRVNRLLADLSPDTNWGDRQIAARKLGYLGDPAAVTGLLRVLKIDDFWMVRCAIIQALEKIGDSKAVPLLAAVAQQDSFQVVRSYASNAVRRLS